MTTLAAVKEAFEAVLRQEALDDRAQFDVPGYFDELPLFSRYQQMSFLPRQGPVDLLIQLALDYLDSIVLAKRSAAHCFLAITVRQNAERAMIVPGIFVCNGWVTRRLRALRLARAESPLADLLKSSLCAQSLSSKFALAQDNLSSPGLPRIFIGYRQAHSNRIVSLPALTELLSRRATIRR